MYQLYTLCFKPLMARTAIWWFDSITHVAMLDINRVSFLMRFYNRCAYTEVIKPTEVWLL